MYTKERLIIEAVCFLCIASLWFIPQKKYREAAFIFLFAQLPAWILGLAVVEEGWIIYPVRELYKANGTSFSFEYLVFPFLCIFFNLYFPQGKSSLKNSLYYMGILTPFTFLEYFTEEHTRILKYIHWTWLHTLISMMVVFYLVRVVYKWFFHLPKPFSL